MISILCKQYTYSSNDLIKLNLSNIRHYTHVHEQSIFTITFKPSRLYCKPLVPVCHESPNTFKAAATNPFVRCVINQNWVPLKPWGSSKYRLIRFESDNSTLYQLEFIGLLGIFSLRYCVHPALIMSHDLNKCPSLNLLHLGSSEVLKSVYELSA